MRSGAKEFGYNCFSNFISGLKVADKKKRQLPDWMMAAGSSGLSPSKKKPRVEIKDESPSSKPKRDPEKSDKQDKNSEIRKCDEDKKKRSPGKDTISQNKVPDSFINDEEESEKELSDEEESESMNLLADISQTKETSDQEKSKASNSARQDISDNEDEEDKENRAVSVRRSCPYGGSCYRKNPLHRRDEAHPGDGDYKDPEEPNEEEDEDKPECDYGVDCYRKNPQHRRDFKHTKRPQRKRAAKAEKKRKKKTEDDYDSDDSFIDDEEDGWEPVDDSDEDADFESPADMSSDLE